MMAMRAASWAAAQADGYELEKYKVICGPAAAGTGFAEDAVPRRPCYRDDNSAAFEFPETCRVESSVRLHGW